jgi:succinate dehydrogenase / fumarate reductase cytochrome b subunit
VLISAFLIHVWAAYELTIINHRARPVGYRERDYVVANYANRTMRWSGVIVGLFVLYHLSDFTWGWRPDFVRGEVYHNVVTGFERWWSSAFYIAANLALGLHLYHGLWSLFQSLGWNNPRFNHWRQRFAQTFAVIITVGNVSFPVAVLAGWVN